VYTRLSKRGRRWKHGGEADRGRGKPELMSGREVLKGYVNLREGCRWKQEEEKGAGKKSGSE